MSKVKVAAPSKKDLRQLADGVHRNPHSILGAHPDGKGTIIRALRPYAESVAARIGGVDYPLHHVDAGVFSAKVPIADLIDYRIVTTYPGGATSVSADGYRFLPTLGEVDLHLFAEGRHERLWDDPDGFDPGRWDRAEGRTSARDAYVPFSAGQRVCPGAGFAMVEGPLMLALICRDLRLAPGATVPVPVARLTVRGQDGIMLRLDRRS